MTVTTNARIQIHAKFTIDEPTPLFVVAAEVLDGDVRVGMHVCVPLNSMTVVTFPILQIAPVPNSVGLDLLGLVIAADESDVALVDAFQPIVDEIWDVTPDGAD